MNNVATRSASTAVAALQSLKTGLANVQHSLPPTSGDALLRMLKDGSWVYGPENIEVEDGSLWAINPMSLAHGFACWSNYDPKEKKKNELLGEAMVGMTMPKPDKNTLPDYGWEWQDQVSFDLVCLSGEDKGEQVHYKTTSTGGVRAVHELIDKIMKQLDVDPNKPVPVVELLHDHYDHRTYGKTYVPIFQVKKWVELSGEAPEVDEEETVTETLASPQETVAPARRRRGAAADNAPQQQAEQQEEDDTSSNTAPSEAAAPSAPRRRRRAA